jgi:hypothetical protein
LSLHFSAVDVRLKSEGDDGNLVEYIELKDNQAPKENDRLSLKGKSNSLFPAVAAASLPASAESILILKLVLLILQRKILIQWTLFRHVIMRWMFVSSNPSAINSTAYEFHS